MKLTQNAQRLRLYLRGFAQAYKIEPSELTAVFFALAYDTARGALGEELTQEAWRDMAELAFRELTSS